MEAPLRALVVYMFLLIIFRIAGKRTFAQITPFDFVLLLIVGEATQQGLIGDDFSVTKALLLITSLLGIDILLSYAQRYVKPLDRMVEGLPLVILEDGQSIDERMKKARVDESDILEAGRKAHGVERLDQMKYAVLERDGSISVVPKAEASWRAEFAST
ncbi:MAG TPA: YetF domain-containing protein [Actinomycetota bacterium]|nr:YetF domain-containing protein [Actinomycetota bacterium]